MYDDPWISYFLYYIKKNKILSLQKHIKKKEGDKIPLIYKTHTIASGLIELYGKNLSEAVKKRDETTRESLKYMIEKTKNLSF